MLTACDQQVTQSTPEVQVTIGVPNGMLTDVASSDLKSTEEAEKVAEKYLTEQGWQDTWEITNIVKDGGDEWAVALHYKQMPQGRWLFIDKQTRNVTKVIDNE
jgi:hypothetical protein